MYLHQTIAAILPCFNEGPCITDSLTTILNSKHLDEIIVINDGSTDDSLAKLKKFGNKIRLLVNSINLGKSDAVFRGIQSTNTNYVFLIDTDLSRLTSELIDKAIQTGINSQSDLLLVPVDGSSKIFTKTLGIDLVLTGQRLIKRSKLSPYPPPAGLRYGLEMYINILADTNQWKISVYDPPNFIRPVTPVKFLKGNVFEGLKNDLTMTTQVLKTGGILRYLKYYYKYNHHSMLKVKP